HSSGPPPPENARLVVVHSYMAHHQGMTVVALANVLRAGLMRVRFHAQPMIQAAELLLQERAPRDVPVMRPLSRGVQKHADTHELGAATSRRFTSAFDPVPRTHFLSNGRSVVVWPRA